MARLCLGIPCQGIRAIIATLKGAECRALSRDSCWGSASA
jgi:hypothetical protein